jgi:hypothetical protein
MNFPVVYNTISFGLDLQDKTSQGWAGVGAVGRSVGPFHCRLAVLLSDLRVICGRVCFDDALDS